MTGGSLAWVALTSSELISARGSKSPVTPNTVCRMTWTA